MFAAAGVALIKLLLGLAVFAVLGYVGRLYDKHIAGVLLTFPILNGIGILTGSDPLTVADSIYSVVILNGLLLFAMIALCDVLPPFRAAPANVRLVTRLIVWTAAWTVCAPLVTIWHAYAPGPLILLAMQCCIIAIAVIVFWKPEPHNRRSAPFVTQNHLQALVAFWSNAGGLLRLALFALSFGVLLFAAYAYDSKWVGMLSALPVPGLFAVATLSVIEKREYFERMRNTVLLGPISVIVFNWLFVQVVIRLPDAPLERVTIGLGAMLLLLLADAIFIFWSTPLLARWFNRVRMPRRTLSP